MCMTELWLGMYNDGDASWHVEELRCRWSTYRTTQPLTLMSAINFVTTAFGEMMTSHRRGLSLRVSWFIPFSTKGNTEWRRKWLNLYYRNPESLWRTELDLSMEEWWVGLTICLGTHNCCVVDKRDDCKRCCEPLARREKCNAEQ